MTALEFITANLNPLLEEFNIPSKHHGLILEILILMAATSLAWLGSRVAGHVCRKWLKIKHMVLDVMMFPALLFLSTWALGVWLHAWNTPTPIISTAGVVVGVWLTFKGIALIPLSENNRKILKIIAGVMIMLSVGNYLRPLFNLLSSTEIPLGDHNISLLAIGQAGLIFSFLAWGTFASADILERHLKKQRISPTLRTLLIKIFKTTVLIFAVLITLNLVGLNLSSLTIFGGALGIGIGFGLKTITSNFISGILLLVDKSIKPGDVISLDDATFGQVKDMNTRYIVLKRRDGMEVLIPNEQLMTDQVINWSFSSKVVRQQVEIGVSYNSDMAKVQKVLLKAVGNVPRVLTVPEHKVMIKEFGDSSVSFLVRFWMNDPEKGVTNLKGEVLMAVWKALKRNNIEIPFPQMVIHKEK